MEKLLLHHCCGPCSPRVVEVLAGEFELTSFWFNPNIHPEEEYLNRKNAFLKFAELSELPVVYGPEISQAEWIKSLGEQNSSRCEFCYKVRVKALSEKAKKMGITNICTTLLVSPYQKHEIIKAVCEQESEAAGIKFIYKDFRPFFYEGKTKARLMGLYMQKYCGCCFSREERGLK